VGVTLARLVLAIRRVARAAALFRAACEPSVPFAPTPTVVGGGFCAGT